MEHDNEMNDPVLQRVREAYEGLRETVPDLALRLEALGLPPDIIAAVVTIKAREEPRHLRHDQDGRCPKR
jgi:hypothetical protein